MGKKNKGNKGKRKKASKPIFPTKTPKGLLKATKAGDSPDKKEALSGHSKTPKSGNEEKVKKTRVTIVQTKNDIDQTVDKGIQKAKFAKGKINSGGKKNKNKGSKSSAPNQKLSQKRKRESTHKHKILEGDLLKEQLTRIERRNLRTLYIQVPASVSFKNEKDLEVLFEGSVAMQLAHRLVSRFYIVEYESEEEAKQRKLQLELRDVNGEKYKVSFYKMKTNAATPHTVYCTKLHVEGLQKDVDFVELKKIFSTACYIKRKPYNNCSCYLMYKTEDEAEKVFREHAELKIKNRKVTLLFAKFNGTGESKKQKIDEESELKQEVDNEEEEKE